jgi:hypothetical protein
MTMPAPPPTPQKGGLERFIQLIVLLIGGGVGGVLTTLATNAIEWRKIDQQAEAKNLEFVDKYLTHVISKDIFVRIKLAEYFSLVLESEKHRDRWKEYLGRLNTQYTELNTAYSKQVEDLEKGKDQLRDFQRRRELTRIESYLGEARDLIFTTPTPPAPVPATPGPSTFKASDYQVFTQFAGVLQRDQIRGMMETLQKDGWKMQGVTGGGERTPAAAGQNEIRYGSTEDRVAAEGLAAAVQKSELSGRSVAAAQNPRIPARTLEIWISK